MTRKPQGSPVACCWPRFSSSTNKGPQRHWRGFLSRCGVEEPRSLTPSPVNGDSDRDFAKGRPAKRRVRASVPPSRATSVVPQPRTDAQRHGSPAKSTCAAPLEETTTRACPHPPLPGLSLFAFRRQSLCSFLSLDNAHAPSRLHAFTLVDDCPGTIPVSLTSLNHPSPSPFPQTPRATKRPAFLPRCSVRADLESDSPRLPIAQELLSKTVITLCLPA